MSNVDVARILNLTVENIEKRVLHALVRDELRRVRAEKASILRRHGLKDLDELWRRIEDGTIDDTVAHDDIVKLDYLEYKERELEKILRDLEK